MTAALVLCAVAPGHAAASGRWHTHVVRYADHSNIPWNVRTAVAQWNSSQTGVRLVRARRGQRAQIRISSKGCPVAFPGHRAGGPCGFFPPDGRVFLASRADRQGTWLSQQLTTHEIGHALGLDHAGGCSVMVPNLSAQQCSGYSCGPTAADARVIVKRYGGRIRNWDRTRGCFGFLPLPPRPSATLVAPAEPATAPTPPPHQTIPSVLPVVLRNDSPWAWGRHVFGPEATDDVVLLTVDAGGNRIRVPNNCPPELEGSIGDVLRDNPAGTVAPGATGTFNLRVCPPDQDQTILLRAYTVGRGATLPGTQTFAVRLRGSSPAGGPGPTGDEPNSPPQPSFTYSPREGETTVDFADTSTDDGAIVAWRWDFGDPASPADTSTEYAPSHTYPSHGSYTVRLTVTDDRGASATTTQQVVV